jgi:hypothetical protein
VRCFSVCCIYKESAAKIRAGVVAIQPQARVSAANRAFVEFCALGACSKIAAALHCFRTPSPAAAPLPHHATHHAIGLRQFYRRCFSNDSGALRSLL